MRVSWRFTRVRRGTAEPKSRRSSSSGPGHCSVLGTLPHAHGHQITRHPWPRPVSPTGGGVRAVEKPGFVLRLPGQAAAPQTYPSRQPRTPGGLTAPQPSLAGADWLISRCRASGGKAQETHSPIPPSPACPHTVPPAVWGEDGREGGMGWRDRPHRGGKEPLPGCRNQLGEGWCHGAVLAPRTVIPALRLTFCQSPLQRW